MSVQGFIIGSALIVLTGCQRSLVQDSMPTVTRTGEVKDVVIRDNVSPATLTVNPGDEIRWINKRQEDVRVIFLPSRPVWAGGIELRTLGQFRASLLGCERVEASDFANAPIWWFHVVLTSVTTCALNTQR